MNVCLISFEYPPESGGVGAYTRALAHGLADRGHGVHVLTVSHDEHDRQSMDGRVHVHRVATRPWPLLAHQRQHSMRTCMLLERATSVVRYITRLHREVGFDVVEAPNWNAEAWLYSLRPLAPLVIRVSTTFTTATRINAQAERSYRPSERPHGDRRWLPKLLRFHVHHWLEALPVRRAARVIAISHYVAEVAQRTYRVPAAQIHVVPLGIDAAVLASARGPQAGVEARVGAMAAARERGAQPTVLYVGRLERRKGTHHLLKAIPEVVTAVPEARFLLIGKESGDAVSGVPYQTSFARFASPEALNATTFVERVDQTTLEQEYAACTVFVAPSLSESFGLVHLEAMARGKPVVACRAGATPEIVADGETGLLVPPEDSHALAQALIRLLQDPDEARQMGERGRACALTGFPLDRMIDRTLAIYRALGR